MGTESGNAAEDGLTFEETQKWAERIHRLIKDFIPEMHQQKLDRRRSRIFTVPDMQGPGALNWKDGEGAEQPARKYSQRGSQRGSQVIAQQPATTAALW